MIEQLIHRIKLRQAEIAIALALGSAGSWDVYQRMVGENIGLQKTMDMIGKVVCVGPLAYKNRDTMQSWPEGSWAQVGDYVRVPKWGGDRWEIRVPGSDRDEESVLFMTLNDHELIARVSGNPLAFKAYV